MKKSFLYNTLIISIIATTSVAISAQEKNKARNRT